jgi:small conductance mechanosensitive channel
MNAIIENLLSILQTWWQDFINNLPALVAGLLIFLLSIYLAHLLSRTVQRVMRRRGDDPELSILITRLVRWTIVGLGVMLALEQAGQDVSALLTGLGILGFTIGFALQDISANLVSGILLLFEQPFDIEDSIEVAGYSGTVKQINFRATELLTWDGLKVLIPNREVFTNTLTNFTQITQRRIGLSVGVGYESDLTKVESIALTAVSNLPGTKKDPAPYFVVDSFGDSAVNTTIYYWFEPKDQGFSEMTNTGAVAIKKAFDQAGINIPYPIRMVQLDQQN